MFCSARGPTHRPPAHLIYPDWRCRARSKAATSKTQASRSATPCALVAGGGYAEYCVAPVAQCLPKPHTLSFAEAAGLPETYFTVWSNVFDRARLAPGESLLVQGGSSGIGVAAIQLAAALGNTVYATAGSDEKCQACVELGAKRAINYRAEDFVEVLKKKQPAVASMSFSIWLPAITLPREIESLADDGRLVFIALLGGAKAQLDLSAVLRRRLTVTGSTLRPRPVAFKAAIAKRLREVVWPLIESGRIKPMLFRTFPLAQAADAHRLMESSQHVGKIVLTIGADAEHAR